MKRGVLCLLLVTSSLLSWSQKKWDAGGDGLSWSDANNWSPNGVPISTDNVLLDNSMVAGSYTVILPTTAITISVVTLTITPTGANTIQLTIPATNTANPGLNVTGAGDALILNNGSTLINSTGVGSGGVGLAITNTFRINNGGKCVHNNVRGNATIVSQLSTAVGTETGIFEFDVPGTTSYLVSLNGRTYGTLVFSAFAAGAPRTYTGNGAANLTIRGDLTVNTNATLSSTMTANILIAGNLTIAGIFDNSPSAGGTGRSILFNGTSNQTISGSGNFTFGTNFRNVEVNAGSTVTLQRGINLSNPNNTFIVNTNGTLQMNTNVVSGNGSFQLISNGWLGMGSPDGISTAPTLAGNVQTAIRSFSSSANYEYNGIVPQITGTGLPTTISSQLIINNPSPLSSLGVTLTNNNTTVDGTLALTQGKLRTSATSLIRISASGQILPYGPTGFIGGPLNVTGHPGFTFPIGINAPSAPTGTIYAPLTMNHWSGSPAGTDSWTAEYIRGNPQSSIGPVVETPPIDHVSFVEYWSFFRIDGGSNVSQKQIILEVNPESICYHLNTLLVARYDQPTTKWKSEGYSTSYMDPASTLPLEWGHVSSNSNVTTFGYFTLSTTDPFASNPLPITLINFDAFKLSSSTSSINWQLAACCSPDAKFEVQRAGTDKAFKTIGTVPGSATNKSFNYVDNNLLSAINYYRLKMIDETGKISYSRTVAVMNGVKGVLLTSLAPTVVTNTATLNIASSSRQQLDIIIIDAQGRTVKRQHLSIDAGNSSIGLPLSELPAGLYYLQGITADSKTNTIRFIR